MADAGATAGLETPADFGEGRDAVARRWVAELERSEKAQAPWIKRCDKINDIYTDAKRNDRSRRYSILWANIQTLAPAVYARTPTAVVSRRFKDPDPVGRYASEVLERVLNFSVETTDFPDIMTGLRDEFLLTARGQAWVRYVPHMRTVQKPSRESPANDAEAKGDADETGADVVAPDGQVTDDAESYDVVDWEEVIPDHVHWKDFGTNVARSWSEVRFVWRRAYLTRDELVDRFGEKIGKAVPLDWSDKSENANGSGDKDDQFAKAAVYEIWDKPSRKAIWISKAYTAGPLDEREDPLGLEGFFPCPRPLLGTCGPDSIIPTPDYVYYQTQAEEINELTARIDKLSRALKARGWYAALAKDPIQSLTSAADNELVPIESWGQFADKGGVDKLIAWMPVEQIANVLKACVDLRKQLLDDVFQITGIADIMRGDTDPNETMGAQVLKANWGSSRVRDRQKEISRFARDLLGIMGEVIASRFSQETLAKISGVKLLTRSEKHQIQTVMALQQQAMQTAQQAQQAYPQQAQAAQGQGLPPPPAPAAPEPPTPVPLDVQQQLSLPTWEDITELLQDRALRTFRVDVETDSTIEPNDQEEKQRRVEFIGAIGKFLAESLPVVQAAPQMLPVITEGLKFVVRGFRVGREMEDVIDNALDQLQQAASQPKPPPPPNPVEVMKAQAAQTSAQADVIDAKAKAQAATVRAQAEDTRSQTDAAIAAHEQRMDLAGHALAAQGQAHGQVIDEHQLMVDAIRSIQQRELRREAMDHRLPEVGAP